MSKGYASLSSGPSLVHVEIRTTDSGRSDLDNDIVWMFKFGFGYIFDLDLEGALVIDGLHGLSSCGRHDGQLIQIVVASYSLLEVEEIDVYARRESYPEADVERRGSQKSTVAGWPSSNKFLRLVSQMEQENMMRASPHTRPLIYLADPPVPLGIPSQSCITTADDRIVLEQQHHPLPRVPR